MPVEQPVIRTALEVMTAPSHDAAAAARRRGHVAASATAACPGPEPARASEPGRPSGTGRCEWPCVSPTRAVVARLFGVDGRPTLPRCCRSLPTGVPLPRHRLTRSLGSSSVQAVTFQAPYEVRVEERPEPELMAPDDAIVRVQATGVCGSDLHIYHGRVPIEPGFTIGHEYVGTVVSVGPAVSTVAVGDEVL